MESILVPKATRLLTLVCPADATPTGHLQRNPAGRDRRPAETRRRGGLPGQDLRRGRSRIRRRRSPDRRHRPLRRTRLHRHPQPLRLLPGGGSPGSQRRQPGGDPGGDRKLRPRLRAGGERGAGGQQHLRLPVLPGHPLEDHGPVPGSPGVPRTGPQRRHPGRQRQPAPGDSGPGGSPRRPWGG